MTYEITPTRWPVTAWPRISQLIGNTPVHVAGGYAAWHMSDRYDKCYTGQDFYPTEVRYSHQWKTFLPSNVPDDMDIFTYEDQSYYAMVERLTRAGFRKHKESKYATTWMDNGGFFNEDNYSHLCAVTGIDRRFSMLHRPEDLFLPIQLIKPVFGKNLIEVLDHFDFYAVKFALLDGNNMLVHSEALKHLDARTLGTPHPDALLTNPFYVLGRHMKYVQKGYHLNYMELFKIVVTAQADNIADKGGNLEQVADLVKQFGQYIHSGDRLDGRGEDFRQTMEDAYGEWLRYLLAKRAKIQ